MESSVENNDFTYEELLLMWDAMNKSKLRGCTVTFEGKTVRFNDIMAKIIRQGNMLAPKHDQEGLDAE